MKCLISAIAIITLLASCNKKTGEVVNPKFVDSLLRNYSKSQAQEINEKDSLFWKNKLDKYPSAYLEAQQYAGVLSARFHLYGNILDLKQADSIVQSLNARNKEKEAGPLRTLAVYAILQHQFLDAYQYVQKALALGSERYSSELLNYDAAFELGQDKLAKSILDKCKSNNEYGYFFRLAKYQHLQGEIENAIVSMKKAGSLAGNSTSLKQAALSNTADLYLHSADAANANEFYMESLKLDASDLHSLMGIGWIALTHDKKDSTAQRIFNFIQQKSASPEILLKLSYIAEQRADSIAEKKYAEEFVNIVSLPVYGNMYNKYLVDLYTGFLNKPSLAVAIAEREILNRPTPQTYSWYVYSLFKNGEKAKAIILYDKYVSGKPLEGLELYYMGKMMEASDKGYNSKQYFKACYKNRYDLSPSKQRYLEQVVN
ncbi:MAG: hypothetical protein ABIO04_01795 [Ferruginibacter sp.]